MRPNECRPRRASSRRNCFECHPAWFGFDARWFRGHHAWFLSNTRWFWPAPGWFKPATGWFRPAAARAALDPHWLRQLTRCS